MKVGEKIEKMESELVDLKAKIRKIEFALSETKRELRGEQAENIVRAYLNGLGMHVESSDETYGDMVAVDPSTKNRVPIEVKSVSLKKHGWEIRPGDRQLEEFTGFYLILLEHEPDDIILHIESAELGKLKNSKGKKEPKAKHRDRWSIFVPASLEGFEQYISPDRFKEAVFGKGERDRS